MLVGDINESANRRSWMARAALVTLTLVALLASSAVSEEAKAALGPSYSLTWGGGECSPGQIQLTAPQRVTPTASTEWIAWRTHIWRAERGQWVYDNTSAWRVVEAINGVVYGQYGDVDTWTIHRAGVYAVTGEVYYYNRQDSRYQTLQLFVWQPFGPRINTLSCNF
jgi:hypothetical protein